MALTPHFISSWTKNLHRPHGRPPHSHTGSRRMEIQLETKLFTSRNSGVVVSNPFCFFVFWYPAPSVNTVKAPVMRLLFLLPGIELLVSSLGLW